MKLTEIMERQDYTMEYGSPGTVINRPVTDSKKVSQGDLFICISGANFDGHNFISEVAKAGAAAIVVEREVPIIQGGPAIIRVADTRHAMAACFAAYFGHPTEKLKTIGITGTKGKTTTSYMIYNVLNAAGIKTGLIGTIEIIIGDEHIKSQNTTPDSYQLQEIFRKMVDAGLEAVVMEVSSQGLMLRRTDGFTFDYGVFTNLGTDHIGKNEHRDFEDYKSCKAKLFRQCKVGIINADDAYAGDMIENATCRVETFSMKKADADLRAENISLYTQPGVLGVGFDLETRDGKTVSYKIDIPGRFNICNSLTAIAVCRHFTDDYELMNRVLSEIKVKGRTQMIRVSDKFTVMVDYAHNAMSFESLINALREYNPGRIVTVFGCGGNRDRNRRFEMGEVSSRLADFTVATSDNPRKEQPQDILNDIITGIKRADGSYTAIIDRYGAIKYALENAREGDVIVIAGKGHEDYQIIGDRKYHMDDCEMVADAAKELGLI